MHDLRFSIFPNDRFVDLGLYQFGRESCEPGHSFGPAARNHFLFHYVVNGTGTLIADDGNGYNNTFHIRSGQGFMIFPKQVNTYIADADHPWEYAWVEFDGLRAKEMLETAGFSMGNPVYIARDKEQRNLAQEEILYLAEHGSESPFHLIGHLYLFLDYLIRSMIPVFKPGGKYKDYYISEAITYIEKNFQNELSVEEIAESVGIDRSYFGKIFKDMLGQTPQNFIRQYRMIKAAELLRLTDLSISDIGNAVGYPGFTHFSRAFKSVYDLSPREYRKQNHMTKTYPDAT